MKPEYVINLSKGSNTPLEALQILSNIDFKLGYHINSDMRPPLGIYNTSILRICEKLISFCSSLENIFKKPLKPNHPKIDQKIEQQLFDNLELALYAAAEHVDDLRTIVRGFYPNRKALKFSNLVKAFGSALNKSKATIATIVNEIKHNQARLRLFSLEISHAKNDFCLYGVFLEGATDGVVGPNKVLGKIFSVTTFAWEIICFLLDTSSHLAKFLEQLIGTKLQTNTISSENFSQAVIAAARLPIYNFDEKHPFLFNKIVLRKGDLEDNPFNSNIYGSISKRWENSQDMILKGHFVSYRGDGVSTSFTLVQPKKLELQHWS